MVPSSPYDSWCLGDIGTRNSVAQATFSQHLVGARYPKETYMKGKHRDKGWDLP